MGPRRAPSVVHVYCPAALVPEDVDRVRRAVAGGGSKNGRAYTCTVRLAKGTWALTISGFTPGNVLTAQAVKTQRVR
jgi:hypothetical protein